MALYLHNTNNIMVMVETKFDKDRSKMEQSLFVFSYHVSVRNDGDRPVQLAKQSLVVTDAFFNVEYQESDGFGTEKPVILPQQIFSYMGYCQLKTSFGTVKGYLSVVNEEGKNLRVDLPEFLMAHPHAIQ